MYRYTRGGDSYQKVGGGGTQGGDTTLHMNMHEVVHTTLYKKKIRKQIKGNTLCYKKKLPKYFFLSSCKPTNSFAIEIKSNESVNSL